MSAEMHVPDGWKLLGVDNLCQLQRGFDITEATRAPGTVPVYSSSGVSYFHNTAAVQPPAVVTGRKGLLGRVFFVTEPFWPHDTTLWADKFNGNDPRFVARVLSDFHLEKLDAATSVPTLNRNSLSSYRVAIPSSRAEQARIATVLDDADSAIHALRRLIAKKSDIKQGVMQELLTGHTRLPGFAGAWRLRRIGDFTDVRAGGTPSTAISRYWHGDIRWMSSGEIHKKRVWEVAGRITRDGLRDSSAHMLPIGTVLMALAGQGKTRGTVAVSRVELSTNQSIAGIFPSREHDSDFLYYNLDTRYRELRGESAGDGGRGGLNLKIIKRLEVHMPCVDEQTAIASVLADVDDELAALKRRYEAACAIRTGMTQELLAGRTRLPVEDAS